MARLSTLAVALSLVAASSAAANVYRVTNTRNSGAGTLRRAINRANSHLGRDRIVFGSALTGRAILPTTPLPRITDPRTIIKGDQDDDGDPDVAINGKRLTEGSGLFVDADFCVIDGLAITNFPRYGIDLAGACYCTVRSCHLGVNLPGTKAALNGHDQLALWSGAHANLIGGTAPGDGNIIAGGRPDPPSAGILVALSHDNTIVGNTIGLNRAGTAGLGGWCGVHLLPVARMEPLGPISEAPASREGRADVRGDNNVIGGTTLAERNVIAGVVIGVYISRMPGNTVCGNTFGLARDGSSPIAILGSGVLIDSAPDSTIGGTTRGAGNVFVGSGMGIDITGAGSVGNKIQGNYFGTNAAGTAQRPLLAGVWVSADAGRQMIGGGTARAGNYFSPRSDQPTTGVALAGAGEDTLIRRNRFGVLPDGTDADPMDYGVVVRNVRAEVLDNEIARAGTGVLIREASGHARIFRNHFRWCHEAVATDDDARCLLGNLDNANPSDDGGNVFRRTNRWYVYNKSPFRVRAEGNDFITTSRVEIDRKIMDRRDDPTCGRVDFVPLIGGILPTGATHALALSGAVAVPATGGRAQVTFTLSAAARVEVHVLNIAGRPIRVLCRARECPAGTNTLLWNGRSDSGLPAPSGAYLVQVLAADAEGQQARAVCRLRLDR